MSVDIGSQPELEHEPSPAPTEPERASEPEGSEVTPSVLQATPVPPEVRSEVQPPTSEPEVQPEDAHLPRESTPKLPMPEDDHGDCRIEEAPESSSARSNRPSTPTTNTTAAQDGDKQNLLRQTPATVGPAKSECCGAPLVGMPAPPVPAPALEPASPSRSSDDRLGADAVRPTSPPSPARRLAPQAVPPIKRPVRVNRGFEVTVHVYDLLDKECKADMGVTTLSIGKSLIYLNDATLGSMNLGFFHAGVEVLNTEFSFGWCSEGTGVYSCTPRQSPGYQYRDSIPMGRCMLSRSQIDRVIRTCAREWQGDSYNLVERNCCGFTNHLCVELGVGNAPPWINNLANSFLPLSRGAAAMSDLPRRMSSSFASLASLASSEAAEPDVPPSPKVVLGEEWEILGDEDPGESSLEPHPTTLAPPRPTVFSVMEAYFCGQDSPHNESAT